MLGELSNQRIHRFFHHRWHFQIIHAVFPSLMALYYQLLGFLWSTCLLWDHRMRTHRTLTNLEVHMFFVLGELHGTKQGQKVIMLVMEILWRCIAHSKYCMFFRCSSWYLVGIHRILYSKFQVELLGIYDVLQLLAIIGSYHEDVTF